MAWKLVNCLEARCSSADFHSGVDVWLIRPGVVNRKIMGAVLHIEHQLGYEWKECLLNHQMTVYQLMHMPSAGLPLSEGCKILVRELLPRVKSILSSYECIIIDKNHNSVSVFQLRLPCKENPDVLEGIVIRESSYQFSYMDSCIASDGAEVKASKICLYIHEGHRPLLAPLLEGAGITVPTLEGAGITVPTLEGAGITVPTLGWLSSTLLPKIVQWSNESSKGEQQGKGKGIGTVPLNRYSCVYQEMKDKYAPSLIKNWPENTDPQKYVFEDIAIASYLLVLWEEERKKLRTEEKQSFVDLGCGNGLLVYLLMSAGHPGRGLDLRERGIWKMYGQKANLEVCTLRPSSMTLFPGVDWLIGNHSDELTPWLPVIASRSSYTTRFFVLPCCAHDFNKKFHRQGSRESQYQSYLKYVREIGEKMGFKVQEDTLRIPSSKRICLFGQERTYLHGDEAGVDVIRQQYIDHRCGRRGSGQEERGSGDRHEWVRGFVPRDSSEPVRNCSQVSDSISRFIVQTITSHLLQNVTAAESAGMAKDGDPPPRPAGSHCWNVGGKIQISEAAKMFDKAVLNQLKKECGGLQTLLRNEHQVFHVHDGYISIRNWSLSETEKSPTSFLPHTCGLSPRMCALRTCSQLLLKTKLCWFYAHHPQGCPRTTLTCSYAHGLEELRARPNFNKLKLDVLY